MRNPVEFENHTLMELFRKPLIPVTNGLHGYGVSYRDRTIANAISGRSENLQPKKHFYVVHRNLWGGPLAG